MPFMSFGGKAERVIDSELMGECSGMAISLLNRNVVYIINSS